MEEEATNITVMPGAIRVNEATILCQSPDVVAIAVDLASKRGAVCGYMLDAAPGVMLEATEETLDADPNKTGLTMVTFDDFPGWHVWCADLSRYTVAVCLVRPK